MNLFEKLLEITNKIGKINKNLEVGVGKNAYKAVGEADVLHAVKQLEYEYKVYSYPKARRIVYQDTLQTEKEYNGQITRGNQLIVRIETDYEFVNVENPEERITVVTYGDGVDTQDKAPGKAMTYADKYGLMKAYKIITGDDPDQTKSPDNLKIIKDKADFADLGEKYIGKDKLELIKKIEIPPEEAKAILNQHGYQKSNEIRIKDFATIYEELKAKSNETKENQDEVKE